MEQKPSHQRTGQFKRHYPARTPREPDGFITVKTNSNSSVVYHGVPLELLWVRGGRFGQEHSGRRGARHKLRSQISTAAE